VRNQQIIQLIIILIIAGSGLIRWVAQQLQEQKKKKAAQDAIERARLETLRTGRVPEAGALDLPQRDQARKEQEAAAARQAQVDEFIRRQQERARQRASREVGRGPTAGQNLPRIPGSSGPTVPMPTGRPRPAKAAPQGPARQPDRVARPVPTGRTIPRGAPQAPKKTQAPAPAPRPAPRAEPPAEAQATRTEAAAAAPAAPAASPARIRALVSTPRTPEEWRRAIVVNTILGPPPGLSGSDGEEKTLPWSV
jgi:hypothetical protein